jgi:hypothetical protein
LRVLALARAARSPAFLPNEGVTRSRPVRSFTRVIQWAAEQASQMIPACLPCSTASCRVVTPSFR